MSRTPGITRSRLVAGFVFLTSALVVGGVYLSYGLFIEPLEREFGWTRTQVTGSLTVGLMTGFLSPAFGGLADRFGARRMMAGSLLVIAVGLGLRPLMTELWHFYALTALVALGAPGATSLTTDRLIAAWFPARRGRMLGITNAGNQVGGLTVFPMVSLMVAFSGWQTAYLVLAALFAVAALLAAVIVREPPRPAYGDDESATEPSVPLGGAVRTVRFYSLMGVFVATAMTEMVMFPQLIPHLQNEGLSVGAATAALTVVSLAGLPAKILIGRLAERWSGRWTLALSLALIMAGTLLLALVGSSWPVWPAVAMFGAGFGSLGVLYALAITELFGLRSYGAILGTFKSVTAVVVLPVPPLAGYVFDVTGSYQLILLLAAAIAAIGIPMLLFMRPISPEPCKTPRAATCPPP